MHVRVIRPEEAEEYMRRLFNNDFPTPQIKICGDPRPTTGEGLPSPRATGGASWHSPLPTARLRADIRQYSQEYSDKQGTATQ